MSGLENNDDKLIERASRYWNKYFDSDKTITLVVDQLEKDDAEAFLKRMKICYMAGFTTGFTASLTEPLDNTLN